METNAKLNKALYNAARSCVVKRLQNIPEEVKQLRDSFIEELFGSEKRYDELTEPELVVAIERLNQFARKEVPARATPSQLKLLRWYQFNCAYVYANWEQAMFTVEEEAEDAAQATQGLSPVLQKQWLSGEALKLFVFQKIEKGERVPSNIFRWMYENWINPTAHKFMLEGGLKNSVKNKFNFHYEYLSPEEAMYLIQRFGQMYLMLSKLGKFQSLTPEMCN